MTYNASNLSLLNYYMDSKHNEFNKELHLLSDLDASLFASQKKELPNQWNIFLHDISNIEENISILDVKILNEIPMINEELEIEVTLQNTSSYDIKNSLLILNINDINVDSFNSILKQRDSTFYF